MEREVIEVIVVWIIVALSIAMLAGILFFSLRDLLKYDQKYLSVLKDQYTAFFVSFALIALALKILLLETNNLDEISNR